MSPVDCPFTPPLENCLHFKEPRSLCTQRKRAREGRVCVSRPPTEAEGRPSLFSEITSDSSSGSIPLHTVLVGEALGSEL